MRGGRMMFKYGGVLFILFFLADIGVRDVTCEWMSYEGCREFKSDESNVKTLSTNNASTCLDACPENTTVIALQGHICDCPVELPKKISFTSNCTCLGDQGGECNVTDITKWHFYKTANIPDIKSNTEEVKSECGTVTNSRKCLAVINTRPKRRYELLDCNTSLPALCYRSFTQDNGIACVATDTFSVWSSAETGCYNKYGKATFALAVDKCYMLNGVNNKKYWTAFTCLPRKDSHVNPSSSQKSISDVLPTATEATYSAMTSTSSLLPSFSMSSYVSNQFGTSTLVLVTRTDLPAQHTASKVSGNIQGSTTSFSLSTTSLLSSEIPRIKQSEVATANSPLVSTVTVSGTISTQALNNISSSPVLIPTTPIHVTSSESTGTNKIHATLTSQNKQNSLERQVTILEYSLGTLAALLVVVIGVGALCLARMIRGLKQTIIKSQGDEQPVYRETSVRNSVFTDSGTLQDFYGDGDIEMEETNNFGPNSRLPTHTRPSYLHNGLTSAGRETSVLF